MFPIREIRIREIMEPVIKAEPWGRITVSVRYRIEFNKFKVLPFTLGILPFLLALIPKLFEISWLMLEHVFLRFQPQWLNYIRTLF